MSSALKSSTNNSVLTIFTQSTAGLGHLRVNDALHSSSPLEFNPLVFRSHGFRITWLNRITSFNFFIRRIMEWIQRGAPQDIFTFYYRRCLRLKIYNLYQQITILLDQYLETPEKVIIITTNFNLAQQLGAIKDQLEENKKTKIFLVIQVTDASPQHIWMVPEADLILVPNQRTKENLELYRSKKQFKPVKIEVSAYPLNRALVKNFSTEEFTSKQIQLDPRAKFRVNLLLSIPGSAVDLKYYSELIFFLKDSPIIFQTFVVSRYSSYTKKFNLSLVNEDFIQIYPGQTDQQTVADYLRLYLSEVISLEITKPTEQSFKVLLDPVQRGGVIMLFDKPIGTQERDNLEFMRSHDLIPDEQVQDKLWKLAESDQPPSEEILNRASFWRGIQLPENAKNAANFINWLYYQEVFLRMLRYKPNLENDRQEVNSLGSDLFWRKMSSLVNGRG